VTTRQYKEYKVHSDTTTFPANFNRNRKTFAAMHQTRSLGCKYTKNALTAEPRMMYL